MTGRNFCTSTPIAPDSLGTACPLSGRNSTYRPVQILEAGWRRVARQEGVALGPCGALHRSRRPPTRDVLLGAR
jgi:hypothetical protein